MKPRLTCTNMTGNRKPWRGRGTPHDPKHTTLSVKHDGGNFMAAGVTSVY